MQAIDFDIPGDDAHRHFAFPTAYETVSRTLDHLTAYWSLLAFRKFGVEGVLTPKASCGHIGLDIGVSVAAHSFGMIPAIRESVPLMHWNQAVAERLLVQFDEEIRQVEGFLWNLPPESQSSLFSKLFPRGVDASPKPVATLHDKVKAGDGANDQQGYEPPGHWELMVNRNKRKVRRVGFDPTVDLDGKVEWPLFIALYEAGETDLTEEQRTKLFDDADSVSPNAAADIRKSALDARRQAKQRLKGKLEKPLGITIPEKWRLECVTPA